MSAQQNYWNECIAIAADECDLVLTPEQLDYLARSAESGHDNYGMAFYSPSANDRVADIEREWKARLKTLQAEFDNYRGNAEVAMGRALGVGTRTRVILDPNGHVMVVDGRLIRVL